MLREYSFFKSLYDPIANNYYENDLNDLNKNTHESLNIYVRFL